MDEQNDFNPDEQTPADSAEFGEDGLIGTQETMMKKILQDKCNRCGRQTDDAEMAQILDHDCGKKEEYAADYNVDEYVADDVEIASDDFLENGEIVYRNTAEYYMVPPDSHGANHANPDDDIFNYQGS